MKMYMIRHGQSEGNIGGFHSAWAQVPLTEKGKADAEMAGQILKGIPFDKVYTSDLIRTIQTQQIALPDAEPERLPMLREINVGSLLGRYIDDCYAEYGEIYMENRRTDNFLAYGGENYEGFIGRIREFVTMIEHSPYENVAVFCHYGVVQMMLDIVCGTRIGKKYFSCDNGSVSVFEFRDGNWRVDAWNCKMLNK